MPTDLAPNVPLPWYLKNQSVPPVDTGPDELSPGPFPWPLDSDEEIYVAFKLSLNQFVAMLSSIDVGSAIAYSDDAAKVYWWFIRNFGGDAMQFCAKLIDCINTDADVQAALSTFMREHPGGTELPIETTVPPGVAAGNILAANPGCNPDILWTQCIGLVQTANRMVVDFLETWETYTNSGEIGGAVLNAIPALAGVVDASGIDGVISYANAIADSIREGYDADYTLDYENALACEIFCAAQGDCAVSLDMLTSIMNSRIGNQLTLSNMVELMLSLIDADVSGFNVADLYLAAFFNMLKVANLVLPITWGIEAYLRTIAIFNEPSDDWMVLCDDCAPEERIPIIASEWDPVDVPGILSGPDGSGFWTVTSTARASDTAFGFRDVDGRNFIIVDKTYSAGPACQVWLQGGSVTHLACGVGDQYTNQIIEEFWTTWSLGGGPQTMTFRMVAP